MKRSAPDVISLLDSEDEEAAPASPREALVQRVIAREGGTLAPTQLGLLRSLSSGRLQLLADGDASLAAVSAQVREGKKSLPGTPLTPVPRRQLSTRSARRTNQLATRTESSERSSRERLPRLRARPKLKSSLCVWRRCTSNSKRLRAQRQPPPTAARRGGCSATTPTGPPFCGSGATRQRAGRRLSG